MVIGLLISFSVETHPAIAIENSLDQPWALLKGHQTHIIQLSSDQEALKFNQNFLPKQERTQKPPARHQSSRHRKIAPSISPDMQATITTFWAAMTTIGHIQKLREVPQDFSSNTFFSHNPTSKIQEEWILSKPSLEQFKHLLDFQKQLSLRNIQPPLTLSPDEDYMKFTQFHDQRQTNSDSPKWTNLLNDLGYKAIEARLHEYWEQQDLQAVNPIADSQKQAYIQQYVTSRLLPIFYAHLLNQALQTEAQAYDVAWESWHRMQQWPRHKQNRSARMRLCGTWKWLIHNHQNHGDHKTTMTFAPPGFATPPQVQPTTIRIHGDAVYLKWTFPQGFQEDSLLLSNHDNRLEGTFTNSMGPHGSISGHRLSPCKN